MHKNNIRLQDYRKIKREEAEARQAEWAKLTPRQQLKALDGRLGKDQGAQKQRARLEVKIRNEQQQKAAAKAAKPEKKNDD